MLEKVNTEDNVIVLISLRMFSLHEIFGIIKVRQEAKNGPCYNASVNVTV